MSDTRREFHPKPYHLRIYVPDADGVYAPAMRAGATSLETPQDKPCGDRSAGVKGPLGNSWCIATYQGDRSLTENKHS